MSWMYLSTSDTVSAPANIDPDRNWTSDWSPAFGGSLHGLYGYWQTAGSCPNSPIDQNRECDVQDDPQEVTLAQHLAQYLARSPVKTTHDAWVFANADVQRDIWSIWEDANNRQDVISSATNSNNKEVVPVSRTA
jgi:hypothetical protein